MTGTHPPHPNFAGEISVGQALKTLRKERGWTGSHLGELTGMSQAKISRIETGALLVEAQDVETLAIALGASPVDTQRLMEQAARSHLQPTEWQPGAAGIADRQREFNELEADSRELRIFQNAVVAGLLQTSEYARAIFAKFDDILAQQHTGEQAGDIAEAVSARVRRLEILAEPDKSFLFVMSESVFTNRLSAPAVMLAQLERIREVAGQANVDIRIVPSDADIKVPPYHGFVLLDDRCVTVDLFNTTILSRVKSDIKLYRLVFDELERVATTEIDPILDRYTDLYMRRLTTRVARQSSQPS